ALVTVDQVGRAGRVAVLVEIGGLDGDVLAGVAVFLPRPLRTLLRGEPERVGVLAGDAPLVGDALGALELRGHLVLLEVGLGDRDAEAERLVAGRADRYPAHRLDTVGEREVDDAG